MWEEESDNNISDNALTLNLRAYGADASANSSSEGLCIDSGSEDDSGSPIHKGRKRKRSEEEVEDGDDEDDSEGAKDGDMPDVVLQMEAEIERQLDAKAKRSNLTVANVKNILKDVITNEQVLDLVRHTMKQPESNFCINKVFSFAPKLTRAKTRELLNTFPSMAWPITPSKNISKSKCKVLIEQDLPEDSSDEEYQPDEDDDDHDPTEHQTRKESNDEKDGVDEEDEEEEQADSDEVDAQGDEEEEEEEYDDDEDEDDEDDADDGHESDQNNSLCKSTESGVVCSKMATKGEEEEDDDDDDCRLVICDNDNDVQEKTSKIVKNKDRNIKRTVINETGTQTSWPDGTENKSENSDSIHFKNCTSSEENICQRTRSKFSLSDTPLETIESAFIPPDITTDMYDSECDDEDWKNFLKGFTQPLKVATQEAADDDDEEIDPEYNIMADEEETDDKEELREDPGVKVSRKEVNALMAELFEYIGMLSDENDCTEKVHRSDENELCSSFEPKNNVDIMKDIAEHVAGAWEEHVEETIQEKTTSLSNDNVSIATASFTSSPEATVPETEITLHNDPLSPATDDICDAPEIAKCEISLEQKLLLDQQLRQNVQFLTQHFLLTYLHPFHHVYSMDCKQNLFVLKHLANNKKESTYNADNLDEAIILIEKWEQLYSSENSKKKYIDFMDKEIEMQNIMKKKKKIYRGQFPPGFSELVVNSKVFIYPLILPTNPFRSDGHTTTPFFESEDQLIAMGLEHFMGYGTKYPKIWGKVTVPKIVPMIVEHFVPARRKNSVYTRILDCTNVANNPINHYFKKNCAPKKIHFVVSCRGVWIPPCQQPHVLLPEVWKDYIASKNKDSSKS